MAKNPRIAGFTTNTTLMRKAGVSDYVAFAKQVLAHIADRPVSFRWCQICKSSVPRKICTSQATRAHEHSRRAPSSDWLRQHICRAATSATVICGYTRFGTRYEVIRGLKRLPLP